MLNAINYTENPKFKPYKIGEILEFFSRKCVLEDNKNYQLVTVKRRNEGIVGRGIFKGKEIKTPTQFYLKAGDFLISKRQIVHGACEIVPEKFDGAIVSNEYSIIRGKEDIVLTEYFNILSKTLEMKHHYFLSSYGIDIEKMVFNVELWKKGIVYLPNVEEQQEIVNVYNKLNKKVQLQQQKIDLLQEQKKGFLQKMFPKAGETQPEMRFGGFTGDWEERKLKEVGKIITGNTPSTTDKSNYAEQGILWVTPTDIKHLITTETSKKLSIKGEKIARVVPSGTILVTCIASIGKNTMVLDKSGFNQQINSLTPNSNNDSYFLLTQSEFWSRKMKNIAASGTMQIVNKNEFSNLIFSYPTLEEQQKIGAFFKKLDENIVLQQKKLNIYKKQKQGFMQQMFI